LLKKPKKKDKIKNDTTEKDLSSAISKVKITEKPGKVVSDSSHQISADPSKRLRNLKKKLKDIEALKEKIDSGELGTPLPEQLDKIARANEVIKEIESLEKLVGI